MQVYRCTFGLYVIYGEQGLFTTDDFGNAVEITEHIHISTLMN